MQEHTERMGIVEEAVAFAAERHSGQKRKGTALPYIVHPIEAAAICARITDNEDIIAAGVLHDVVEDTGTPIDEIREQFGESVARIVSHESEDKRRDRPAETTWRERKQETIDAISSTDDEGVLIVCLADKLSNMRSIRRDFAEVGEGLWSRFRVSDPAEHRWYYRSIAEALKPSLGGTLEWAELDALIEEVFGGE